MLVIHEYHLGDVIFKVQRVQEVKDLGVTISSNLSWELHVTRIVFKANRMLDLLKRTCPLITDIKVRRTLSIPREITAFLCDSGMVPC